MTDRKLTNEEYELVMDHVSDIYDVISEIKGRLSEIYDSAGEICDIVKCAEKVDTTNFKLKELLRTCAYMIDWKKVLDDGDERTQKLFADIGEALK